jgi:hypothetical protein
MDHPQYDEEQGGENPHEEDEENEGPKDGYGRRRSLRCTNWQYRADALRRVHFRILGELQSFVDQAMEHAISYAVYGNAFSYFAQVQGRRFESATRKLITTIAQIAAILHSLAYTAQLEIEDILYYPLTNRQPDGDRFPPIRYTTIDELSDSDALAFTGFNKSQLRRLYIAWRMEDCYRVPRRYTFTGEEILIYFLFFLRKGHTYTDMSRFVFGGDPRRFSYAIRVAVDYLYNKFYHKISGDSMSMWLLQVESFRRAIWTRLRSGALREEVQYDGRLADPEYVITDLPFEEFRVFGFIDDYGVRCLRPGDEATRVHGFTDDIQRAYYSGYLRDHGMKAQVVFLPNGMVGSVFVASIRHNDNGVLNMSGLNAYLVSLLHRLAIPPSNFLPALYGDGIFQVLETLIPRYRGTLTLRQRRMNLRMSGLRQSVEHCFAHHKNIFRLFSKKIGLSIYMSGETIRKLILVSFFVLNCYFCFNETMSGYFQLQPPTLEDYLPLDEELEEAPVVTDDQLGLVYTYGQRERRAIP